MKPGFTPGLCCAKMRKVEQMLLQLPLAHGQIFVFFVCRCLSKNDRTSHFSVAPGEVLESCQEAGEQHIFNSFLGQIWKRFSLVLPFLPTAFRSQCLFLFCVIFK